MSAILAKWRAFFICNDLIKPVVHFFPHSMATSAPYAVACTLTIFGRGLDTRSSTLEGARINQPDGVRLDAIFPELIEKSHSLVGLDITLECQQRKIDLSASQCVIELITGKKSLRYFARILDTVTSGSNSAVDNFETFPVLADNEIGTSLIAINGGETPTFIGWESEQLQATQKIELGAMGLSELGASFNTTQLSNSSSLPNNSPQKISPQKISLPNSIEPSFDNTVENFGSRPLAAGVYNLIKESQEVAYYLLHRDLKTKAALAVQAL